nr:hypothetical protein BaRGS_029408 [Batillaria attramentaria]
MMAAYVTLLIAPLLLATAKSELLFLDVTTNAQLGRVKAAFKGLNVVHSAKDGFPELPDDNLYFVERSTDYTGINEDQMQALVAKHAERLVQVKDTAFLGDAFVLREWLTSRP